MTNFAIIILLVRIIEVYNHESGAKKKKRPKIRLVFIVFILLITVAGATFFSSRRANLNNPSVLNESSSEDVDGSSEISKNYDLSSIQLPMLGQTAFKVRGGRIWSSGTNNQVPMASITKVVTALAVLEKAPLSPGEPGEEIVITAKDEQYYTDYLAQQGTVTGVTVGQTISQYHALQAILLASSNNIADTLADHYFGNRQDFIIYANSMLLRLGLEDTKVADASGFNPESVSTPSDLIALGEYSLDNPLLAEIVAQEEAVIMDDSRIPNYNALIGFDEITGIKPGFTDEAGYCLLFSANFKNNSGENEQFIAVVMGIEDRSVYFETLSSLYEGAKKAIAEQNGKDE